MSRTRQSLRGAATDPAAAVAYDGKIFMQRKLGDALGEGGLTQGEGSGSFSVLAGVGSTPSAKPVAASALRAFTDGTSRISARMRLASSAATAVDAMVYLAVLLPSTTRPMTSVAIAAASTAMRPEMSLENDGVYGLPMP